MIKNALHIYRKNIWNVFAILGFVCLGIFIGCFVVLPAFNNNLFISYNKIISIAKSELQTLNADDFYKSLSSQLDKLDWANPVRVLRFLFEQNGLLNIIENALLKGGLTQEMVGNIRDQLSTVIKSFGTTTFSQVSILFSIIMTTSVIGYFSTKLVIQINSTNDKNILRFIGSFLLNLLALAGIVVLLLITLLSLHGAALVFAIIAIYILMLIATLAISIICYKKKDIKLFDILNIKNLLFLFLSNLIVFAISFAIIVIVDLFSGLIALLLSIPVILITTIIVENIVVADITNKYYLTNKKS